LNQDAQIVIIGCGAGGGTAAQFARKTDRKANITVFEKGKYPQYSKCGLPYAISGIIPKIHNLIEFDEEWFKKQKIDLFLNTNVEKIDLEKKIIYAKRQDQVIQKPFTDLIICTGSKPFIPPVQNIDCDGVFVVRTIDDAEKIQAYAKKSKTATIVGAGFIGLEIADNLYKMGLKITVVEALSSILATNLDEDMAKILQDKISSYVKIYTDTLATKINSLNNSITSVTIKDKKTSEENTIQTDILIIATGTRPQVLLAESIGCKIGKTGGILVNEKSETSIKGVYAVGDCTEYLNFVNNKPALVGLGSIVVRQAIAAGTNAAGQEYKLTKGLLFTFTSDLFDLELAGVGLTSNFLEKDKFLSGKYSGHSLPEYYPGGKPITVKVITDTNGKILGAQAVGDKAAQRIDTFACAILAGFDVETLRKLETAYAPPVAPTLDAETLACDIVSLKLSRKR
jgi:NADH oxidase (H2O2-forming)